MIIRIIRFKNLSGFINKKPTKLASIKDNSSIKIFNFVFVIHSVLAIKIRFSQFKVSIVFV